MYLYFCKDSELGVDLIFIRQQDLEARLIQKEIDNSYMPPSEIPLTFVTFRKSISYLELIGVKLLTKHDEEHFSF